MERQLRLTNRLRLYLSDLLVPFLCAGSAGVACSIPNHSALSRKQFPVPCMKHGCPRVKINAVLVW